MRNIHESGAYTFAGPLPPLTQRSEISVAKEHLARFLRDLDVLIGSSHASALDRCTSASQKELVDYTAKLLDQRLPFRELAPSRQRIVADDGPFTPDRVCTRSGVFSVLVFRGILFSANKLLDGDPDFHPFFEDLKAFEAWRGTGHEEDYCQKVPYGYTKGRHSSNAANFWTASEDIHTVIDIDPSDGKANFQDVADVIQSAYTFGDLVAYLTAVDLAYAGAVQEPTSDDIAKYSTMGAKKALRMLQLPYASRPERADSLERLYQALSAELTEGEKERWIWDRPMLEHTLCKYSKCAKYRRGKKWGWCRCSVCIAILE
ncbi:hypothetical protein K523DRAFT_410843 [Schizophyllum commune Tattone D]|nr:hypothetical protein K523DRAFT_410843 [Schizophyllum commune Tattone D]